jgi:hypothetical protein
LQIHGISVQQAGGESGEGAGSSRQQQPQPQPQHCEHSTVSLLQRVVELVQMAVFEHEVGW